MHTYYCTNKWFFQTNDKSITAVQRKLQSQVGLRHPHPMLLLCGDDTAVPGCAQSTSHPGRLPGLSRVTSLVVRIAASHLPQSGLAMCWCTAAVPSLYCLYMTHLSIGRDQRLGARLRVDDGQALVPDAMPPPLRHGDDLVARPIRPAMAEPASCRARQAWGKHEGRCSWCGWCFVSGMSPHTRCGVLHANTCKPRSGHRMKALRAFL